MPAPKVGVGFLLVSFKPIPTKGNYMLRLTKQNAPRESLATELGG